jgi:AcrR family transcriptional regulator
VSAAFIAADEVVQSWTDDSEAAPNDKAAHVRAVARAEFGRKGYEVTTIRDIASAAGLGTGTVYRLIGSKDELLASIMQSFGEKVAAGWTNVLRSDSSVIEKLDGLSWVNTNALDRFGDEFRIQLAWMRQSPPDTPNIGWLFAKRVRQMKSLLAEGIRSGEIKIDSPSNEILAPALADVHTEVFELFRPISKREDVGRAALADDVEDRHVFSKPNRIVERKDQDQAQRQALGACRDGGSQNHRRWEVAVLGPVMLAQHCGEAVVTLSPRAHLRRGGVQLHRRRTDVSCSHKHRRRRGGISGDKSTSAAGRTAVPRVRVLDPGRSP